METLTKQQEQELALLITLGLISIKVTPYTKKFLQKFNITKLRYIEMRKKGLALLHDYIIAPAINS